MTPSISGCIIGRNDATRIGSCIESLANVALEVIVVDTGSTDDTPLIARAAGARAETFLWCDDFSVARNYSLSLAQGDWIVVLDTDETLAPAQGELLRDLINAPNELAYGCRTRHTLPDGNHFWSHVYRLFRRDPRIRFSGRVHEQIELSLAALGRSPTPSNFTILHAGYAVDQATNRVKAERNLRGLLLDLTDDPTNGYLALKIGQLDSMLGDSEHALEYLTRSTPRLDAALAAEAHNCIAGIHLSRQEFELALRSCAESITRVPCQRMGYVVISQVLSALGRPDEATEQLRIARSILGPTTLVNDLPEL